MYFAFFCSLSSRINLTERNKKSDQSLEPSLCVGSLKSKFCADLSGFRALCFLQVGLTALLVSCSFEEVVMTS